MAAREVENDFIGVPCGIMDQMAVALAKPGQALGLDCASLAATPIPIPQDWRFAVFHSGETRALADGRYAVRRAECADAARRLGVNQLCRAEEGAIARLAELPAPLAARARHAVTENARARAGAAALLARDMSAFADLMNESHRSLRDDFEVTTPWIDRLVQASRRAGASGARMTGGGFGGCIVSLMARHDEPRWAASLASEYPDLRFLA
jgi:galactokinase